MLTSGYRRTLGALADISVRLALHLRRCELRSVSPHDIQDAASALRVMASPMGRFEGRLTRHLRHTLCHPFYSRIGQIQRREPESNDVTYPLAEQAYRAREACDIVGAAATLLDAEFKASRRIVAGLALDTRHHRNRAAALSAFLLTRGCNGWDVDEVVLGNEIKNVFSQDEVDALKAHLEAKLEDKGASNVAQEA